MAETLETMEPADARVVIAQDVLAGLAARRLIASSGNYCTIYASAEVVAVDSDPFADDGGKDLKDVIANKGDKCAVCAKGALFIAAVERFNGFTVPMDAINEFDGSEMDFRGNAVCEPLLKYFSQPQLDLIENAFEGSVICGCEDQRAETDEFYEEHRGDPAARMAAIMENIIANKGTFKP